MLGREIVNDITALTGLQHVINAAHITGNAQVRISLTVLLIDNANRMAGGQQAFGQTGADKSVLSAGSSANLAGLHIGYEGSDGAFEQTGGTLTATFNASAATRVGSPSACSGWPTSASARCCSSSTS